MRARTVNRDKKETVFTRHGLRFTVYVFLCCEGGALEGDFLEVGHALELSEALVDLFVREAADAVGAELLDVEGGHDGAEDDGAAQRLVVNLLVAREVSHEAA